MNNNFKDTVRNLIEQGRDMVYIADWLHLNMRQMRCIILKNEIFPCETDAELEHFNHAMTIKSKLNEVYFISDLAKITDISISTIKKICKMYDLKPTKKAICTVCGAEIDIESSKVVKKYCSKECYREYRNKRNNDGASKKIIKQCVVCSTEFEGKSNSKFCSSDCKTLHSLARSSIQCLKDL